MGSSTEAVQPRLQESRTRWLMSRGRSHWPRLWPWTPLIFAAVYVLVVLVNFSSLISAINMNSDAAIALVIGKLLGSAPPGTHVLLGQHPWYEELWFLRATAGLPGYRQLWDIAPAAWTLLGFGLVAWSTWRVLGARAAAITFSALLCLGAGGRSIFFAVDAHSLTALHTILLGVLLTWLAANAERLRAWQLSTIALIGGAISAAPVTGDTLFLYWALLPMLATSAVLVWRTRSSAQWNVLAVAVGISVVALSGGYLLREAVQHAGWQYYHKPVLFAMPDHLLSNLVLLGQSSAAANSSVRGPPSTAIRCSQLVRWWQRP